MNTYTIVIERTENNYAAYAPDVPGCIATAETEAAVIEKFKSALEFHFRGLRKDNLPIPEPSATSASVSVEVAA